MRQTKVKYQKMTKKDFTKEGLLKLVNHDIEDINKLEDEELISIVSFFKFLICPPPKGDTKAFLTNRYSIIARHKAVLEKNHNVQIKFVEEMIAG